jgi:anhydro-N-acetylmuramic acid kinase
LGEPARVAARTGLPVVAEFRQSDVAAGGQGAPLVPWTDWVIFHSPKISRAIQNIGGIANVSWLPAGCRPQEVVAFDTGPGNMVIDALVRYATGGREQMDRDGRRAARGRVIERVLDEWLSRSYFLLEPPKTTGREQFGEIFAVQALKRLTRASRRPEDWIATATALTARSIASAYRRFLLRLPAEARRTRAEGAARKSRRFRGICGGFEIVVCGGGARNRTLMDMLRRELPEARVRQIDEFGVLSQAKEALSFAMMAKAFIDGVTANLPQVTGAARPVIMGCLVEP